MVIIPLLVLMFRAIHRHYLSVAKQLTTEGLEPLRAIQNTVIVSSRERGHPCLPTRRTARLFASGASIIRAHALKAGRDARAPGYTHSQAAIK